jgi:DNA-binding MarR family transcriptional regulator
VLRHHSAVGLIDRAVAAGLVKRNPDPTNKSAVRIALTASGQDKLDALSELHIEEIAHLAPTMQALWGAIEQGARITPHPAARRAATDRAAR